MNIIGTVLAGLAGFAILVFLHPYLLYPWSLRLMAARPLVVPKTTRLPTATLFFAAYNEESSLPAKIANVRLIVERWPNVTCSAYSDCSTDNTLALLQAASDALTVMSGSYRAGKATGMRLMVEQAQSEICIFTDANVMVDPDSIGRLLSYFANEELGGLAGTLKYINDNESTTAHVGGMYWRLEEWIKRAEARCGSIMGADGSIFATRRSLYPIVPAHLLDDMTVSMAVILAGKRLIHATDVIAYERSVVDSVDEFKRKRRIACRAYNTHLFLYPSLRLSASFSDKYKYISHKLLRWFGLVPLALSAVLLLTSLIAFGFHTLALLLILAGLMGFCLGWLNAPGFRVVLEILRSIYANFVGVIDALRGRTYQTWAPAQSR